MPVRWAAVLLLLALSCEPHLGSPLPGAAAGVRRREASGKETAGPGGGGDAVAFLQEDNWQDTFMWELGTGRNGMLSDSQGEVEATAGTKLGKAAIEVFDGLFFLLIRFYFVLSVVEFMKIEMCHTGQGIYLGHYTLPDFAPEVERNLFETTYMNRATTIKERRHLREFPLKHAWLSAHNDLVAEEAMRSNDVEFKEGDEEQESQGSSATNAAAAAAKESTGTASGVPLATVPPAVLLQLNAGLTSTTTAQKKPKLLPAIPERFSGFKESPRHWTDRKTGMTQFCNSALHYITQYALLFSLVLYALGVLVQVAMGLCGVVMHILQIDHDINGADRKSEQSIRDWCLS